MGPPPPPCTHCPGPIIDWNQHFSFDVATQPSLRFGGCLLATQQLTVELCNGTLTNLLGFLHDDADLTLTIPRAGLLAAMTGQVPLAQQVAGGQATLDGDPALLLGLGEMLVHFDVGFEIMPGTGEEHLSPDLDTFAQDALGDSAGG